MPAVPEHHHDHLLPEPVCRAAMAAALHTLNPRVGPRYRWGAGPSVPRGRDQRPPPTCQKPLPPGGSETDRGTQRYERHLPYWEVRDVTLTRGQRPWHPHVA